MSAYLTAEHLIRDWDGIQVNVSLSCEKGTMTTIVGASGSGKTTVLRLIAGLERSDARAHGMAETITLGGKDITRLAPGKRGIGMVFQTATLFPHLRVDDNVGYGLRCAGMGKKESRRRADEFLAHFTMAGYGARSPETLSGGEAQRVSLARTLIVRPDLVLFDEPLSALDAPLRKKLAAEIRTLQAAFGFTGIMVTHDLAEAKAMSDVIMVMDAGRIVWRGAARDFDDGLMTKPS